MAGFIPLERGNVERAMQSLDRGADALRRSWRRGVWTST